MFQKRDSTYTHPEGRQHGDLAEYCYKIEAEVTPNSKLATVVSGEKIAVVLSALINSGGGVLITHLLTRRGDKHDICLDNCQKDIVDLITQENWIPGDVFTDTIVCAKNEAEKELYFLASKTTELLTTHSYAYYLKKGKPESIVDNNELMSMLAACTCENDTSCEKHKDLATKSQVLSMLPAAVALNAHQFFPVPESESEPHLCRNYTVKDRPLAEVLNTQSVQCEILDLVSALANTNGGSIFLGVTNTTTPTVEGYTLTENDEKSTKQHIADILTGKTPRPVTIWGNSRIDSTHYWKVFIHNVVGDDSVRKVVEIRVNKCPGGMFCALPVCLDIRDSGEIYRLDSFPEWKKRFLCSTRHSLRHGDPDHADEYRKHSESKETTDRDMTPVLNILPTGASMVPKPPKETVISPQFCWCLADNDGVVTESLQFDRCCSKELADSQMDISTTFSAFPPTEALVERFANIERLEDTLNEILKEHRPHNGVAVFMENLADTALPIYANLKDVTPVHHVIDLVTMKERYPAGIVSIFKDECSREEAKKYSLTLGRLLKRDCSKNLAMHKSSIKLFFQCDLFFIGHGYVHLQNEAIYPKDYLHPSTDTTDTVRYALARILLDCRHITDRYANSTVTHLSSHQARVLLVSRKKVLIVKSIAGSGKTVLALEMARRLKQQHGNKRKILFLCRSKGLAAFVKAQSKNIKVLGAVKECNSQSVTELSTSSFSRYTDIIVDDAHSIPVLGEPSSWRMYNALFSSLQKRQGYVYIFLDSGLQNYRGCTPDDIATQLESLAGRYVGKDNVQVEPLGKILRNSHRICQFTKACVDTCDVDCLSPARQMPEDGIFFQSIQGRDTNQDHTTTLLSRLSHLKQCMYRMQDIAIVTDSQDDKIWVKEMLKGKYATQEATQFPVKRIVVDTLENFEGLESAVILFIIPQSWGSGYVGSLKYRLCVVTRAISRLEFLLPWDPSKRLQDLEELKRPFSLPVSNICLPFHGSFGW